MFASFPNGDKGLHKKSQIIVFAVPSPKTNIKPYILNLLLEVSN